MKFDNPRAFPLSSSEHDRKCGDYTSLGMSLRDYFAGQAIGALAGDFHPRPAAKGAYEVADAMLAEREGK